MPSWYCSDAELTKSEIVSKAATRCVLYTPSLAKSGGSLINWEGGCLCDDVFVGSDFTDFMHRETETERAMLALFTFL